MTIKKIGIGVGIIGIVILLIAKYCDGRVSFSLGVIGAIVTILLMFVVAFVFFLVSHVEKPDDQEERIVTPSTPPTTTPAQVPPTVPKTTEVEKKTEKPKKTGSFGKTLWGLTKTAVICTVIGFIIGSIFRKNDLRVTSELAEQFPQIRSHLPTPNSKFRENASCGDALNHYGDRNLNELPVQLTEGCWTVVQHPVNWQQFTKEWNDGSKPGDWVVFQVEPNTHLFGPIKYPEKLPDLGLYYSVKVQGRGTIRFLRTS